MEFLLLTAVLMSIFLLLYNQGYMVLKSISAVSFVGSRRGNSARFTSCSGNMKRVVRFKKDGTHSFVLDAELSKGDMSVELLDSEKNRIMLLNRVNPSAAIAVEKKKKYNLIIRFQSATGRYTIVHE